MGCADSLWNSVDSVGRHSIFPPSGAPHDGLRPCAHFPRSIGVARIAGVNIPTNKRVTIGLRYIFGIGPSNAAEICDRLTIPD